MNKLAEMEFREFVIRPAMEFKGTLEDLGYREIKTPHGSLYVSMNPLVPESEIWALSGDKRYRFKVK